ncbi:MAG: hypothetical protein CMI55_02885 [Parcubacteria group bacterium]|jgi:hypothetical protein|nr:hypothetical protein [Parcubacteria group bacterium]
MTRTNNPEREDFYDRPSRELLDVLPGTVMMTEGGVAVVHSPHGFNDLERSGMIDAYNEGNRNPGDICITSAHNYPQCNVVGSTTIDDDEGIGIKPQLVWLQELYGVDGSRVNFNQLIKDIMEGRGLKIKNRGDTLDFAKQEIDRRNVTDRNSPVRLVQNRPHPLARRNVQYVPPPVDSPTNDVGTSFPKADVVTQIDSKANIRKIMDDEARRLGKTLDWITTPKNIPWVQKRSKMMKYIYRRAANGGFPE